MEDDDLIMVVDDEEGETSDNTQAVADEIGGITEETANDEELAWQLQVGQWLTLQSSLPSALISLLQWNLAQYSNN